MPVSPKLSKHSPKKIIREEESPSPRPKQVKLKSTVYNKNFQPKNDDVTSENINTKHHRKTYGSKSSLLNL